MQVNTYRTKAMSYNYSYPLYTQKNLWKKKCCNYSPTCSSAVKETRTKVNVARMYDLNVPSDSCKLAGHPLLTDNTTHCA